MFIDAKVPDSITKTMFCDQLNTCFQVFRFVCCWLFQINMSWNLASSRRTSFLSVKNFWIRIVSFPSTRLHSEMVSDPDVFTVSSQNRCHFIHRAEWGKKKKFAQISQLDFFPSNFLSRICMKSLFYSDSKHIYVHFAQSARVLILTKHTSQASYWFNITMRPSIIFTVLITCPTQPTSKITLSSQPVFKVNSNVHSQHFVKFRNHQATFPALSLHRPGMHYGKHLVTVISVHLSGPVKRIAVAAVLRKKLLQSSWGLYSVNMKICKEVGIVKET